MFAPSPSPLLRVGPGPPIENTLFAWLSHGVRHPSGWNIVWWLPVASVALTSSWTSAPLPPPPAPATYLQSVGSVNLSPLTSNVSRSSSVSSHILFPTPFRTTLHSAASRKPGKGFPLVPARRRIPAQAAGLKQYRSGPSPVSSVDDSEQTTASLGHSEELSVQHPPAEPPPGHSSTTASRKAWKARLPSADRTPGTFSQTIHSGPIS